MKYLYCIVIFCFLGCTCKKGEIPEGSICPEYGSSIGRHFTWDEADSVKQKAAYFLLSQINSYTCNSAGQTVSETIPPAFLIRHIESKVGQYRTCSWLNGMTFETFSEYLLPYRVGDEDPFRFPGPDTLYRTKFDYLVRHYDDCRNSPYQLGHFLLKAFSAGEAKFPGELVPEVYKLRFLGIPATIDFLPVTERENLKSAWIYIPDDRLQPQAPGYMQTGRIGKVYQKTFSRQPIPQSQDGEYIPSFFRNAFQKDVTDQYLHTQQVTLSVPAGMTAKHVYLAMYTDREWVPVSWSKVVQGQCCFTRLGTNTVYLPVYYQDSVSAPWAPPFILYSNGDMQHFMPDKTLDTLVISRIRPYYDNSDRLNHYFPGSHFESADDSKFENNKKNYPIPCHPHYKWGHIRFDTLQEKRFWRHSGKEKFTFHLAELQFLDERGQVLKGRFFGPDIQEVQVVTDNNPDTYKSYKGWIGIDFGKRVKIAEIRYLLPGDGYQVRRGHRYELFYFYDRCWKSAGVQTACREEVRFSGIPAGCLYQLLDLDNDEYSTMFTVENRKIRFH